MIKQLLAIIFVTGTAATSAQDFPSRPIRLIVPFAAGGGSDIVARALAGPLSTRLGQPVVVENKPGGGATLGADLVAKAPADGHTLLYTTPGPQMSNPYLMAKLPYDPKTDLLPVSSVAVVPNVLVVHKDVPVASVKDLIQYAKSRPGKVNYASAGTGASSHLAGELFKQSAGVYVVHIPYRGTGQAVSDLLSGHVQMAIDSIAVFKPHIDSGALKALGVATTQRSDRLPGTPTISETLPGFDAAPINYISVPAKTPASVIERLNREINAVLRSPEVTEQLAKVGVIPQGNTPAQMTALIASESRKWQAVIRYSGAKID
ncbi:Bug family tripartite tricarboxylate transporter substrate binding protein [Hydrogenophaga sp.]|uniref:Bug family tripartite tricarboxylate transporter substrate binding protein n=1 Tax=Hydrogenophaga sp. TaxID=1904254 RepID=UPI002FC58F49